MANYREQLTQSILAKFPNRTAKNTSFRLTSVVLAILLAGLLTACGPQSVPAETVQPTLSPQTVTEIDFLWWGSAAEQKVLASQLAEIDQQFGVKITLDVVEADQADQILMQRISDGDAPDLARTRWPKQYQDDAVSLNFDTENWPFRAATLAASTNDDQVIAAPYDMATTSVYINTDAFNKAAITIPDRGRPWRTWDELLADASIVSEINGMDYALAIQDSAQALFALPNSYQAVFFATDQTSLAWSKQNAKAALETYQSGYLSGEIAPTILSNEITLAAQQAAASSTDENATPADSQSSTPTQTPSVSASPEEIPSVWPAETQPDDALQLFEEGKVPILITDGRTTLSDDATLVPNVCQDWCGGVASASYLTGFSAQAKEIIKALTSEDAQNERAEQASVLPASQIMDLNISDPTFAIQNDDLSAIPAASQMSSLAPEFDTAAYAARQPLARLFNATADPEECSDEIAKAIANALNR